MDLVYAARGLGGVIQIVALAGVVVGDQEPRTTGGDAHHGRESPEQFNLTGRPGAFENHPEFGRGVDVRIRVNAVGVEVHAIAGQGAWARRYP